MKTSGPNTTADKTAPEEIENDLEAFDPAPPNRRIDDKAAALEQENTRLKANFNRERFVYILSIAILFNILIASIGNRSMVGIGLVGSLLLLLGLSKFLDFPWIVAHLDRWHDLALRACEKFVDKPKEETEPLPELDNKRKDRLTTDSD
ncbi:hypothetical protein N183_11915 [Sinorhizobium sp. Sb3]|uniref:hypothetical protein n=1 Tax=Sinorhizobium sp. Sb3 TaxID=1358417 RepID=UPI00071D4B82|nr:hypothetical protein [Sinorhizobium sp. Sb3]KSV84526.1 hypothetical protein N183_11915 [Sinorhizobium sp. Sb3]